MKDDMDTLCSLWTDDGVLLLPGSSPLVGKKAICDMLQQQRQSLKGAMTTDYTEEWQSSHLGQLCLAVGQDEPDPAGSLGQAGHHARQCHSHPAPRRRRLEGGASRVDPAPQ